MNNYQMICWDYILHRITTALFVMDTMARVFVNLFAVFVILSSFTTKDRSRLKTTI